MEPPPNLPPIEQLILDVRRSGKYAQISESVIRRIGTRALTSHRRLKDAVDATRAKLHQIAGAYLDGKPRFSVWRERLQGRAGDEAGFHAACQEMLQEHASTRERAPLLEQFYSTTLNRIAPIHSLLDIGCGLNPLTLPWMPLAADAVYHAYDIHADLIDFLADFFLQAGIQGEAHLCDAASERPEQAADVALLLKVLPVLDQQERAAGLTLLRALHTPYLLVSFPTRTLCGRNKGMAAHYETRFLELIREESWSVERFLFEGELCFLIDKGRTADGDYRNSTG